MVIEISIALAVLIFAILTVYVVRTLCALRRTLHGIDRVNAEVIEKLNRLDSTLQTISNLGEISKLETNKIKIAYHQSQLQQAAHCSNDVAEWLGASIKLASKLFLRRQSNESSS